MIYIYIFLLTESLSLNGERKPVDSLLIWLLLLILVVVFDFEFEPLVFILESWFKNENGSELLIFGSGDFDSEAWLNIKSLKLLSLPFNSLSNGFSLLLLLSKLHKGFSDCFYFII